MAIIFGIFYLFDIPVSTDEAMNPVYSGLVGIGANFFFIFASLSPVGEFFWRLRNGIKKAPPAALELCWQKADYAFNEVVKSARNKTKSVSKKVRLYYSSESGVNAFALGHRTVVLTDGMLRKNDLDVFKGVIAHEVGHIAHGDSDLNLGINVCNGFISVFMSVISVFVYVIIAVIAMNREKNWVWIAVLLRVFFNVVLVGIFRLWTMIGVACINATSRKKEYAADKFAKDIGYGEELSAFLSSLGGGRPVSKWYSVMYQTHPETGDRIKALAS